MKKISVFVLAVCTMVLAGCGAGNVLNALTNNGTGNFGNVLTSVLGLDKVSAENLVGTWRYTRPGVAFTSENLLAKAGGEVAANAAESKLATVYSKIGVKSTNTYFTFTKEGQYQGQFLGVPMSGSYTYDPSTGALTMQGTLIKFNAYIQGQGNGIAMLFEGTKLLTIFQTVAGASGSGALSTISSLSSNYKGLRIGFEMSH